MVNYVIIQITVKIQILIYYTRIKNNNAVDDKDQGDFGKELIIVQEISTMQEKFGLHNKILGNIS